MVRRVGPITVGVALLLVACSAGAGAGDVASEAAHDEHAGQDQLAAPVEGARNITVHAVDLDFDPPTLDLEAGEPVNITVVNDGSSLHDFTLEIADVHVNVEPGNSETTSLTIDEPGTYVAVCTVTGHAAAGMTIQVHVT